MSTKLTFHYQAAEVVSSRSGGSGWSLWVGSGACPNSCREAV